MYQQRRGSFVLSSTSFDGRNGSRRGGSKPLRNPCLVCNKAAHLSCACRHFFCAFHWQSHFHKCHTRLGQQNLLPSLSCDIPALRNRHRQVEPRATASLPPLKVRDDIHRVALSNHDKVKIMHVPPVQSYVCVRPCDDKNEAEYFQTLRMVQEYGVRARALRKTPLCGQPVLAVHKGLYYRATVISFERENKIRIGLVEFGITKVVNFSQLKFLPEFLEKRSIHIKIVNLKEVPNQSLEKRREHLEMLKKNGCQLTLCFEGDLKEAKCELIAISNHLEEIKGKMDELSISSLPASSEFTDIDNMNFKNIFGKDINAFILDVSQIISDQLAIVKRSDLEVFLDNGAKIEGDLKEAKSELIPISNQLEEIERQMDELSISPLLASPKFTDIDDIKFKKICGKNIEAFILDVSQIALGKIAIVERSDLEEFLDNGAKIDKFCQSLDQTPHMPSVGEICFVLFDADNCWYRALCKGFEKGIPEMFFIDFGNTALVDSNKIRPIDKSVLFDCLAVVCHLEGIPMNISPRLTVNMEIRFDEVYYESDRCIGKLTNV